jgi:hypothetical protein
MAEKYLGSSVVVVMFIILQHIRSASFMNFLKKSGYKIYKTFMALQSVAWKVILIYWLISKMNRMFIYTFLTNTAVNSFFKALLTACFILISYLAFSSTQKMKGICFSKMPIDFHQTT